MRKKIATWLQVYFVMTVLLSACRPAMLTPEQLPAQAGLTALKLLVSQPGMYRLSASDLRKAGFAASDPAQLRLTQAGQPVPLSITGEDQDYSLAFYGTPLDSQYTHQNVYWLEMVAEEEPAAAPMLSQDSAPLMAEGENTFQTMQTLEEELVFSPLIAEDPWYWMALNAPVQKTVEISLEHVSPEAASLKLTVWGSTQAPTDFDHHLIITINGAQVIDEQWDGNGAWELEGNIPAGVLTAGKNTLVLDAPGDSGAIADNVFLQRIELQYRTQEIGAQGFAFVQGQGKGVSLEAGKEDLQILDVTQADQPRLLTGLEPDAGRVTFMAEVDRLYLVLSEAGYLQPELQQPVLVPDIRQFTQGAAYLVVGSAELLDPLQPLLALREEQGISTLALPLEAVYDQFHGGIPEPEAIHQLVVQAVSQWQVAPRYLLLIGDASYDPQGYLAPSEANRLPVYFLTTEFGGWTGSDLPYVQVDGDELPDLAVGRVPARSAEELQIWVDKTLAYEAAMGGEWQQRALAVADGQEASFQADAQQFLDLLSASYQGELFAPQAGARDAAGKVVEYLDQGYGIVGYFGHGSLNMWGRDKLFTNEDIQQLQNKNLPIVVTMTCLNGMFIHPTNPSLAETLLLSPAGAAAVLAPSSLTLVVDQVALGVNFYRGLAEPGDQRLGDVLLAAQRLMPLTTQGQREVLYTFLLFGDPALSLPGD